MLGVGCGRLRLRSCHNLGKFQVSLDLLFIKDFSMDTFIAILEAELVCDVVAIEGEEDDEPNNL